MVMLWVGTEHKVSQILLLGVQCLVPSQQFRKASSAGNAAFVERLARRTSSCSENSSTVPT
eukprot:1431272-Amphidinium_carterae.1